MPQRLPGFDDTLIQPVQYVNPEQVAEVPTGTGYQFQLPQDQMQLTPQEQRLYDLHLQNLYNPEGGIDQPDGARSSLLAATVEVDGRTYVLPTVFSGKQLQPGTPEFRAAIEQAGGLAAFPSYNSQADAERRYNLLHSRMELDTRTFLQSRELRNRPTNRTENPIVPRQEMPDIIAGRMTPDQQAAARYLKVFDQETAPKTAGKRGTADEGLDFYSKVPGEVQFINGTPWIFDETREPEHQWRRFTPSHAYDARTGQLYEAKNAGQEAPPLAGNVGEIPERAGHVAASTVTDPFVSFGQYMERARLGLIAPRFVDEQQAAAVAGAIASGEIGGRRSLPGGPHAAPGETPRPQLTQRDLGRLGLDEVPRPVPLEQRLPEAPAVPEPVPTSQYRTRPGGTRPQGHITAEEFAEQSRQRRLAAERPETDEAGFFINALERGKKELPDRATATEMRQHLRDMDVSEAEMAMLGLDRFLLGDAGHAQAQLRFAEQDLSRLANRHGRALRKVQQHPENPGYRDNARETLRSFQDARARMPQTRREAAQARQAHIEEAYNNFRDSEIALQKINARLRGPREPRKDIGSRFPTTPKQEPLSPLSPAEHVDLLRSRAEARRQLLLDRNTLEGARSSDPSLRIVTRQEVLDHIRANRPRMGLEIREFPPEPYGDMTKPINKIMHPPANEPNPFEAQLIRRGIDLRQASDIAITFSTTTPQDWGQQAAALSAHMRNPNVIREALEEAAGASLIRMAQAYRASSINPVPHPLDRQSPRYRSAIPDRTNPTMQEIAVTLEGPWSVRRAMRRDVRRARDAHAAAAEEYYRRQANTPEEAVAQTGMDTTLAELNRLEEEVSKAPRPPFTSGHWGTDIAPIGHMQTTTQLAPITPTPREVALVGRLKARLDLLQERKRTLELELGPLNQPLHDNAGEILRKLQRVESEIATLESELPQTRASSDAIYMGNQFQSDWSGAGMEGFRTSASHRRISALEEKALRLQAERADLEQRIRTMDIRNNRNVGGQMAHMTQIERETLRRQGAGMVEGMREHIGHLLEVESTTRAEINGLKRSPEYHALVANTRAWLRPMLEQFIDRGIASGAKYIGIPDAATVARYNSMEEGTQRLYNEMLRPELKHVMERRNLPYREQKIGTMYSPNALNAFHGTWYIIELPQHAKGGRGVRLMVRGIPVPQQENQNGSP